MAIDLKQIQDDFNKAQTIVQADVVVPAEQEVKKLEAEVEQLIEEVKTGKK